MIRLNMVICKNCSQTQSHSSCEIIHSTPSLINMIILWLRAKGKAVLLFSMQLWFCAEEDWSI